MLQIYSGKDFLMNVEEIVGWLEHGVPSNFVIHKECEQHFKNPRPWPPGKPLELDLLTLARFIYPHGLEDYENKENIYKDMIQRFKDLL